VAYSQLRPPRFIATSKVMPQTSDSRSNRLAGIAAQFGIDMGGGGGESADFYAELVRSAELLFAASEAEYVRGLGAEGSDSVRGSLADVLFVPDELSPKDRTAAAVGYLRKHVVAVAEPRTGLVVVRVEAPSRELAVQLNRRLLALLNDFNLRTRQSQATEERKFIETRRDEARREFDRAERALERFLDSNRMYQNSPQLAFQAARLQRQVDFQQQVYTSVAQAHEQARVDEVRNTPVLTVVEGPELTAGEVGLGPLWAAILAALAATLFAIGLVMFLEYLAFQPVDNPTAYAELRSNLRTAIPVPLRRVLFR
jgi:uncharacterized protein involved in exopolysaccharide biosynthesis